MTGLGFIHYMRAVGNNHFDVVPVDLVTNQIVVGTAFSSLNPQQMLVYNSGTSH